MLREHLIGLPIGRALLLLRDKYHLFRAAHYWPETVGTVANDQLASKLVASICKRHATFIDVGAHIGSVIAEVKHHAPNVKVIAIEAIPEKVANLKRRFPFVEIHQCAVSESVGETTFYINTADSGYSSLGKPRVSDDSIVAIEVKIKKLDDIITADDVDVIKIDVEGAELGVLLGAKNLIARCRPVVMFESGPRTFDNLQYSKEALYAFFEQSNYLVIKPSRLAFDSRGLTLDGFLDAHEFPRATTNYFGVPKERAVEVLATALQALDPKPYRP